MYFTHQVSMKGCRIAELNTGNSYMIPYFVY